MGSLESTGHSSLHDFGTVQVVVNTVIKFKIFLQKQLSMNTLLCRKFDIVYKKEIYPKDLEKIYERTKCRKPCSYKKYSLVGGEQPAQIDNGHLLFSLAAMQDSIEVFNY